MTKEDLSYSSSSSFPFVSFFLPVIETDPHPEKKKKKEKEKEKEKKEKGKRQEMKEEKKKDGMGNFWREV
jgi:hypothetical protein